MCRWASVTTLVLSAGVANVPVLDGPRVSRWRQPRNELLPSPRFTTQMQP